jgi:hypothetical protein
MKNFFTSMLGALVALFIFSGGAFVVFVGFVGAIAAMGGGEKVTPEFEKGAYLVFDLSTNITMRRLRSTSVRWAAGGSTRCSSARSRARSGRR